MANVNLADVSKIYPGNVEAVSNFNLQINDGEFIVLVGPSGCGKSTVLRMIAGLEEITGGEIRIGERVVNEVPPKDRDIAMVFQNYALYPHMSVYDNMAFGLKLRKFPRKEIRERIDEAAKILGLEPYLSRRPKELSGGQRQRVAVGRAIVRHPAVFLFDEPLSNLDAKLRVRMRVEINQLHSRLGATMIYVTHDQVEAMTMGDRIVVMNEGSIQQIDRPVVLYDNPANKFVAGFIGTPPMNFFDGQIEIRDDEMIFDSVDGFSLVIPENKRDRLDLYRHKPVTMGLRPEDVKSSKDKQYKDLPGIKAIVDVVEPMGSETCVYFCAGITTFISRVDSHISYKVGAEDRPALRMDKARFFDSETGKAI